MPELDGSLDREKSGKGKKESAGGTGCGGLRLAEGPLQVRAWTNGHGYVASNDI
jgi:hypothetical protein